MKNKINNIDMKIQKIDDFVAVNESNDNITMVPKTELRNYIPKFKPTDWENTLKENNPEFVNYSQLNDIEGYLSAGEIDEDCMNEWIKDMIDGGVDESKANILADIFQFTISYYQCVDLDWADDPNRIIRKYKKLKSCEWVVEEENNAAFMTLKKPLKPELLVYGEVLATKGQTDDFEDLINFDKNI